MPVDILPIVMCGDRALRHPAERVDLSELGTPAMARLISEMRATMEAAPGVGLAAPQVGVPLQLAVIQDGPERWGQASATDLAARQRTALPFTVLVNPSLIALRSEGTAAFYEGCLSIPGLTAVVNRYRSVRVEALDEQGEPFSRQYNGWPARIVQHEIDHLGGTLYLDRAIARSLSTTENYLANWAGRDVQEVSRALAFELPATSA
ncbi:MAG TPA: peptide deformylase [Acidimicrobiales bacterium]|nr:peptide deformylase [Acidimicrobiales bacterium]